MCGRYQREAIYPENIPYLNLVGEAPHELMQAQPNVYPTNKVPTIVDTDDGHQVTMQRWGLIPFYAKEIPKSKPLINARAETIAEKPTFRNAFKHRRCLIPASAWYEWTTVNGEKTKQEIVSPKDEILFFAGIWEQWKDPKTQELTNSCAILTRDAAESIQAIHARMPVVLNENAYPSWLNHDIDDTEVLMDLTQYGVIQEFTATAAQ